jgi:DNA-binding MarR family transcriptional regulator
MPARYSPDTIGFLIADTARLLRAEFDRRTDAAGLGLTPAEARTLSHVARVGPVRQAALAERMGIEAMTLSACLDRLEAQGYVQREADPSDRRAKLVDTTEAAGPALDQIFAVSAVMRADMTEGLDAGKVEELRQMLIAMRRRLVAMRPDCARGSAPGSAQGSLQGNVRESIAQ